MVRTTETKLEKINKKSANSHFHVIGEKRFLNRIKQLEEFIKTNETIENITTKDSIYDFVVYHKRNLARGITPEWKMKELKAIGVSKSNYKARDERMKEEFEMGMKLLVEYKAVHGHCYVPGVHYKASEKNRDYLRVWAMKIRKRRNKLKPEELQRLEEVGFIWNTNDGMLLSHIKELELKNNKDQTTNEIK